MRLGAFIEKLGKLIRDVASLDTARPDEQLRLDELKACDQDHLPHLGGELLRGYDLLRGWIEHDDVGSLRKLRGVNVPELSRLRRRR